MATSPPLGDRELLQFQIDFYVPLGTDSYEFSQLLYQLFQKCQMEARISRVINTPVITEEEKRNMN